MAEMNALGFTAVPTVLVGDRAFPGFPDEALLRELGRPADEVFVYGDLLKEVEVAIFCLGILRQEVLPRIPSSLWDERVLEGRERPLGEWVHHVFAFADEVVETYSRKSISWESNIMRPPSDSAIWRKAESLRSFEVLADYGSQVTDRLTRIVDGSLLQDELRDEISTPWGRLPYYALLRHVSRHSAVHLRQIVDYLGTELGEEIVPEQSLNRIPFYYAG